ncbi:nucleoside 2-deoxyribosyltransferase [Reinekea blandensis]|uniref:Nucleoside 2-deoxyribosyltransferase n=1 Tax=Reinekea blandensis MED297 TaxID=314283 RepID=A4BCS8_9GAMM|nr:nucleoside 2-deoxyribosyltransferase [Reinekea blandensis]EAR10010.1 hypothetical protein MED297_07976 [Reinekea sp. MED297] [Reinekea blandensis MED297]
MSCPICLDSNAKSKPIAGDNEGIECPICGQYIVSGTVKAVLEQKDLTVVDRAKLSFKTRLFDDNQIVEYRISTYDIQNIDETKLPNPFEQLNLLVRYLGHKQQHPADYVGIDASFDYPVIGAVDQQGMIYILSEALNRGIIQSDYTNLDSSDLNDEVKLVLTLDGWDIFEKSKTGSEDFSYAFLAMKFNEPVLEHFVSNTLKPGCSNLNLEVRDLRESTEAGLIDARMLVEIQNSSVVIADLTHANNGAYWEAGYATGLGKPVIYMCEKSAFNGVHFDTAHHYTLVWDKEKPQDCVEELQAVIRNTLKI